jgi:Ca2+-binding RTX toxin-like protein
VFRAVALAGLAAGFAVLALSRPGAQPRATPTATITQGTFSQSNSKAGEAILTAANIGPGDSVDGTVTIENTGTISGSFGLSALNLVDTPGPNGGELSRTLHLVIEDVTNPGSPSTVYSGRQAGLGTRSLGTFAAGESHTYRFTVSFPNADADPQNAYQGSSMSVQYHWEATASDLAGRCANERAGTESGDVLIGTGASDRIVGRPGDDLIRGRHGADCLFGQEGNDRIFGGRGDDRLSGGMGKDRLSGARGDDRLSGGRGDDRLSGARGKDSPAGGRGRDTIYAADGTRETVRCGRGVDRVKADRHDRLIGCERKERGSGRARSWALTRSD